MSNSKNNSKTRLAKQKSTKKKLADKNARFGLTFLITGLGLVLISLIVIYGWQWIQQQFSDCQQTNQLDARDVVDVQTTSIDYDATKILVDDSSQPLEIIDITKPQL